MIKPLYLLCVCAIGLSGCLYGETTAEVEAPTEFIPLPGPNLPDGSTSPAQGSDTGATPTPAPENPSAPDGSATGLPADVLGVIAKCNGCHGSPLAGGATIRLMTYADLTASSPAYPSMLVIDRVIARMTDAARPMPPGALPPSADVDVLAAWRAAGMPGVETDPSQPPPPEPEPQPEPELICSSGTHWTEGLDKGSSRMNPGLACISCHQREGDGPGFSAAGTLFPTFREPDLCNGADGTRTWAGAVVEIIDANGVSHTLSVNQAGNFSTSARLVMPIRARVLYQGKVREMFTPQNSGDCNSCHTVEGTSGAPGRVALP